MFHLSTPVWGIAVRTLAVYVAILLGFRIAGKREIGQMTVFDLVVLLLIANAVQNSMVGPDTSLTGGLVAACVLLLMNWIVARLRLRSVRLRRMIEGSPTVLVLRGRIYEGHLRREGVDLPQLEAAIREHGVERLSDVEMAVLETDGTISIVPQGTKTYHVRPAIRI